MEALRFAHTQSPHFHCRIFTPPTFNYTVKSSAADVRRTAPRASSISAAVSRAAAAAEKKPRPAASPELPLVSPSSLTSEPGCVLPKLPSHGENGSLGPSGIEYLTGILSSKVYDVAFESPLQLATNLSRKLGNNIWIKREDLQPQWKSVERLGATVVRVGDTYDEAQACAQKRAQEEGLTFVPPFDHPHVIMGQGTVGKEIMSQAKCCIDAIFVPVGGGGLIAGIAAYVKMVDPDVKIIGVEPNNANAMALSLHHGRRIMLDQVGGFADGVAVKVVGEETFRLCRDLIDGVVFVSRDAICASIRDMFEERRSILEPAGALALAGAEAYCKHYNQKDQNIVVIASGANMNFDRLGQVTDLS
ncbi:unnamed protein product [Cuscuta campestris]|uniref:threonine ammonia-lyase n=1 Tax=Cuscuta campestris TaxID=132261 RepID=A0A484LFE0_9ASTE|nr:unnamed protein product [Cuscuta campestris]